MPRITIQKPTDQPSGRNRLLDSLRQALATKDFAEFHFMVAFAKAGPLYRLESAMASWLENGKTIRAIIGVDEKGTSKEALEFALSHFTETHIAHVVGPFTPTFHPKLYLFSGDRDALAFIGSNNLTVGGTETNLESHLRLTLDLPGDGDTHNELIGAWSDALAVSSKLTPALLSDLLRAGVVVSEAQMRAAFAATRPAATPTPSGIAPTFPTITIAPPSALPAGRRASAASRTKRPSIAKTSATLASSVPPISSVAQTLVMQIVPHHNGEVFLSKKAIDQDPAFFGWPFTGLSTPKKGANKPYPQRVPDPVVDLKVFDGKGAQIIRHPSFGLNTVYYETKHEIRVTVPSDVVKAVPSHSILVMRQGAQCDYEMDIYVPGSSQYTTYLQRCNQTMPSGGSANPRNFGWL